MRITATEEMGLRLMVQLAGRYPAMAAVGDLATTEGLAEPFAAKVVALLKRAGLVRASRGRSGGYVLGVSPDQITVLQVFRALGERLFDANFCDRHGYVEAACRRRDDCALRPVWAHLDAAVVELFGGITLSDLVAGEAGMRDRLSAGVAVERRLPVLPSERGVSQ
ncbi:MAG: RrF2 family transcriptional regulator [Thermoanaerobaculaceae bacterium]